MSLSAAGLGATCRPRADRTARSRTAGEGRQALRTAFDSEDGDRRRDDVTRELATSDRPKLKRPVYRPSAVADYKAFEGNRIKHLEMIQAVIGRLGNNSSLVKGWAVTVAGVFFGFAVSSENGFLAMATVLPTMFFWSLDTYYLWSERLFRVLYDQVRAMSSDIKPFYMAATSQEFIETASKRSGMSVPSKAEVFRSATLWRFYAAIIAAGAGLGLVICFS